ncbi:MAG: DUF2071 domain-containing protein [Terriglobales bacterium]
MGSDRIFLTAEWRNLAMLNYEVDASLLLPFVPAGTELDRWNGRVFVSLVGFQFLQTRVWGLAIPFHANFDEVNLRFYVRRQEGGETRRGVVFIREIVPRRAIAVVARTLYHENYVALPMAHEIRSIGGGLLVAYRWRNDHDWSTMRLEVEGRPEAPGEGSHEQFITEHYWGYAAQPDGGCVEYRVTHPAWRVWKARQADFAGDVEELYGKDLASVLRGKPASALLAEGSSVTVMRGHTCGPAG